MRNHKRPVYLVVQYVDPDNEEGPYYVIAIKQTSLAAELEADKSSSWKVKKGFVTA